MSDIQKRIDENRLCRRELDRQMEDLDDELIDLLNQKFMLDNGYGIGSTIQYHYSRDNSKIGTGEITGIRYFDKQDPAVIIVEGEPSHIKSIGFDRVIRCIN